MLIVTGDRHGCGTSGLLLTRVSPIHVYRAKGSAESPKLVRLIGSSSTRTDELFFNLSFSVLSSLRSRVFCLEIRLPSRRDVVTEPEAAVQRDTDCSCSLSQCLRCDCPSYRVVVLPSDRSSCPSYGSACSSPLTFEFMFKEKSECT